MKKILILLIVLLSLELAMAAPLVSFFEEFPDEKAMSKVDNLNFDTRIYLAAKSLAEFYELQKEFQERSEHIKEVIYWPILEKEEGYWISPWSDPPALERIFEEIKTREETDQLEVLLDLEPPLKRSKWLNFNNFRRNKKYITDFVQNSNDYGIIISTVEKSNVPDWLLEFLGLSFDPQEFGNKKIKMYYSSYRRRALPHAVVNELFEKKVKEYQEQGSVLGLGLIAPGIHDETHKIPPAILQKEIEIASAYGIEEVIIFRLDGLNGEYARAIKNVIGG